MTPGAARHPAFSRAILSRSGGFNDAEGTRAVPAVQDSRPDAPLFTGYARKKALNVSSGLLHLFDAWQFPTLAWGDPTLPSALRRFTSEFGMGSGGTTALQPPGKFFAPKRIFYIVTALPSLSHTGHILQYAPADVFALRPVTPQNLSFPQILYPVNNAENLNRLSTKTPLAL